MSCAAIATAKNSLPKFIRLAESGTPVELSRHGKSVAVILSYNEYILLKDNKNVFSQAYKNFKQKWQAEYSKLTNDDFSVFERVRAEDLGRAVDL